MAVTRPPRFAKSGSDMTRSVSTHPGPRRVVARGWRARGSAVKLAIMRLAEIANRVGGTLDGDGAIEITGVSSIEEPRAGTLTFLADPKHAGRLDGLAVAAILLRPGDPPVGIPAIRVTDPYLAFVDVVEWFHEPSPAQPGIHATAVVAASARLGRDASVGPHVVVGENVVIGDGCVLHAGVVIYAGTRIGERFTAHARVV